MGAFHVCEPCPGFWCSAHSLSVIHEAEALLMLSITPVSLLKGSNVQVRKAWLA